MSKYYRNTFPNFLAFLAGDFETGQPHHDINSQNLEWSVHIDIKSISLTFSRLFGEF